MAVTQTLSVTEVAGSINTFANTSKVRILWQSTQTGDSWNGYTRTAKYYVSINGEAEKEYVVSYTLPQNSTKTIVDTTLTITHKSNGSGTVKVRTWMDTRISAGVVEKTQTITLTTITKPTINMTLSPVTPYAKFASLYLQGRSKVKATFTGSGGTVTYSMQVEGKSYSSPYTSDLLRTSGKVTVTGTVTDGSGFPYSTSSDINVIPYDAPYIASYPGYKYVICERCTKGGTPSDTGTYLHVMGTRNYTKINTNGIVNTCSVRCRYKPEGGNWSHDSGDGVPVLLWTDTTKDTFDVILPDIVSNTKLFYTVELNIIDDTYIPTAMVFNIPSENIDFHLREDGKGAAFGKYATQENLLEVEWDAKFNHGVTIRGDAISDFPIEEGTEGIWTWRKWHSGIAECFGLYPITGAAIATPWGSLYETALNYVAYFPQGLFLDTPVIHCFAQSSSNGGCLSIETIGETTNEHTCSLYPVRATPMTVDLIIAIRAIGKWK